MNSFIYVDTLWSSFPGLFDISQSVTEIEWFYFVFLLNHTLPWKQKDKFNFLKLFCVYPIFMCLCLI